MPAPPTKRTVLKTVRLSARELTNIQWRAYAVGLPVSIYLRGLAFGRRPRARRRYLDSAGNLQLSRLGNNVRQLLRVAEASRRPSVQEDLEATIAEIRDLLHAVMDASEDDEED